MGCHLRVVQGRPWKQTLAWLIDRESPFGPPDLAEAAPGDTVVVILDTEPQTVLCAVRLGEDRDLATAIAQHYAYDRPALPTVAEVELVTGHAFADWDGLEFEPLGAARFVKAVEGFWCSLPVERLGGSSATEARILAESSGRCTLCGSAVDMSSAAALENLAIHTASDADVRSGHDWPALLCTACHDGMTAGGFTGVVDFWFSSQPPCPSCGAQKACLNSYGMPTMEWVKNMPPWVSGQGCVVMPDKWTCGSCGHGWA